MRPFKVKIFKRDFQQASSSELFFFFLEFFSYSQGRAVKRWVLQPLLLLREVSCEFFFQIALLNHCEIRHPFLRSYVIVSSGGWSPGAVAVTAYCSKGISKTSKRTSISFSVVGMRRWVLNGISGQIVFLKIVMKSIRNVNS